jgi:DNA-directed RNA polymerase subunit L
MDIKILNSSKDELDVEFDNPTVAEILRCKLNEQGAGFAAWRRDHPSKPVILKIKSSGKTAKKAVSDAVDEIKKELDGLLKGIK